ncbi:Rha family transcriptional regulator [Xanthobacter flavus]|uniref:Rha family transcriptional regulator n=1 Tax=Xanthobacter flavus TaxID=281 RepID=UPI001AEB9E53|nr:Rha family transcriptional regulator [Xanthobacter flavus]
MGDLVTAKPIVRTVGRFVVASSKDVAAYFGKRHDHVLRDIDTLMSEAPSCAPNFGATSETVVMPRGGTRQVRSFDMTRDGFTLLAMGFTGAKALKFKLAYIAEFNAMEEALKAPPPVSTEIAQLAATVAQMEERPRIARARR